MQNFGDIIEIIIVILVVVVAPLVNWLIKFFSPKPAEGDQTADADVPPPVRRAQRPSARPVARPLPPDRTPPSAQPARPMPSPSPVARRAEAPEEESGGLPEIIMEMLGAPPDERRRVLREEMERRRQKREPARQPQPPRPAKPQRARQQVRKPAPPPEPQRTKLHKDLPSDHRTEVVMPSQAKQKPVVAAPAVPEEPAPLKALTRLSRASKSELRRAILLSEVLGPPVSQRPPRDFPD